MHLNELKEELKRVLPDDHPFLEKFNAYTPQPDDSFDSLVKVIEDWERGIRDWSEVRDQIEALKVLP